MRFIVQYEADGGVYAYYETEKQFAKNEMNRACFLKKLTRKDLANECDLRRQAYTDEGYYHVVKIPTAGKKKAPSGKKKVARRNEIPRLPGIWFS